MAAKYTEIKNTGKVRKWIVILYVLTLAHKIKTCWILQSFLPCHYGFLAHSPLIVSIQMYIVNKATMKFHLPRQETWFHNLKYLERVGLCEKKWVRCHIQPDYYLPPNCVISSLFECSNIPLRYFVCWHVFFFVLIIAPNKNSKVNTNSGSRNHAISLLLVVTKTGG